MKVERIEPAPPPVTIRIEMTETEAEVVCALLGGVRGLTEELPSLRALFHELSARLPKRSIAFCDLFVGEVCARKAKR